MGREGEMRVGERGRGKKAGGRRKSGREERAASRAVLNTHDEMFTDSKHKSGIGISNPKRNLQTSQAGLSWSLFWTSFEQEILGLQIGLPFSQDPLCQSCISTKPTHKAKPIDFKVFV